MRFLAREYDFDQESRSAGCSVLPLAWKAANLFFLKFS
jgi:hypothetical protein